MIDFDNAIATIRDNNGFKPNKYDDSYYRTYNTPKGIIQVRVSNHGTHLWTWVNNAPVNPSECYANICIVLSQDGKHNSSTTVKANKFKGEPYTFEVTQYVYNCTLLTQNNAAIINQMIQQIPQRGKFYDPLKTDTDKHAGVYKLMPNQAIQTMVSQSFIGIGPMQMIPQNTFDNKARPSTKKSYGADAVSESKNNESKTNNMKKNMKEQIDMGQVKSAQDVRDEMRKRQVIDNMPEVRELKRKVNRMRLELDNCEKGSQAEKELISKIKTTNQQIRDYYDRPLNLRSLLDMNESKTNKNMKKNTIRLNENTLRQIVAESVKRILKEDGEGIEMMDSIPSESYGKYGELMEKLDEEGDKGIEFILKQNGMLDGQNFSTKQFSAEQVYAMLILLKDSLIHALDTRYW